MRGRFEKYQKWGYNISVNYHHFEGNVYSIMIEMTLYLKLSSSTNKKLKITYNQY